MPTRRRFLFGCSALAVTASVAPAKILVDAMPKGRGSLDEISYQDFLRNVGTMFRVRTESGGTVEVRLTAAQVLTPSKFACADALDARHEKFSLLFTGPHNVSLPQTSCELEHDWVGRFTLFLSPVGQARADVRRYQACFNRPVVDSRGGIAASAKAATQV